MKLVYDVPVVEFLEKSQEALVAHWDQVADNKEKVKLAPNVEQYILLQEAGVLKNIALLDGDKIVGYSVILVQPHLHYRHDLFAFVDVIYVDKEHRNSRAGVKLINATEELCRELGVSVLTYHTKPNHPAIEKLLYRKDYVHMENTIGKCLR